MTRCENCGRPHNRNSDFCQDSCQTVYTKKSDREKLFSDWLLVEGIDYRSMLHGEQIEVRKRYNDFIRENEYKLSLRINPGSWTKERESRDTAMTYYRAKLNAIQADGLDAYDAMEVYNAVCNMVGVTNTLRSAS